MPGGVRAERGDPLSYSIFSMDFGAGEKANKIKKAATITTSECNGQDHGSTFN